MMASFIALNTILMSSMILLLSWLKLTGATTLALQAAVGQIISEFETQQQFKKAEKCDLFLANNRNLQLVDLVEYVMTTHVIRTANIKYSGTTGSKCLIVIMTVNHPINISLVNTIVSQTLRSIVISIAFGEETVRNNWERKELASFPRNIVELAIYNPDDVKQISASLLCTQNLGHTWIPNVNLWLPAASKMPVMPLNKSMPSNMCSHPLYNRTLRAGYGMGYPYVILKSINTSCDAAKGFEVSLFKLLIEKFGARISCSVHSASNLDYRSKIWIGRSKQIADGNLDISVGLNGYLPVEQKAIGDYTRAYFYNEFRWTTRNPVPLPKYNQFLIVFDRYVWVALLFTLLMLSILFASFYYIYRGRIFLAHGFTGPLTTPADFGILTFASSMEPEALPWFPKYSAGKFLILIWSMLNLFINNFYSCNLRSCLMQQNYEHLIDSAADVVQRGQAIYIPDALFFFLYTGRNVTNPNMVKVKSLTVDHGGIFKINDDPPHFLEVVLKECLTKGAIFATSLVNAFSHSDFGFSPEKIHIGKELLDGTYAVFHVKKGTTWIADFDRTLGQIFDMGIVDHFLKQDLPVEAYIPIPRIDTTDEVKAIEMEQVLAMILLFGIGNVIASILFAGEVLAFQLSEWLTGWP